MNSHLTRYLRVLAEEKALAANTLQSYRRDLAPYLEYLQERGTSVEGSSHTHVQGYLHHLRKMGRAPATISRFLASARSFYHFLLEERTVERDPTLRIEAPKAERKLPQVLSVKEAGLLLDAPRTDTPAGLRDKAMLELLYATGIRVSELVSLDRGQVFCELGFIRIIGKAGKERLVPLHKQAAYWLDRYIREARAVWSHLHPDEEALFPNHLGKRLTRQGFWKIIKKYAADTGIEAEITPHTLRHSFAVHLLENGADLKALQEMLGHAGLASTIQYARSQPGMLKEVYTRSHPRANSLNPTEGGTINA